MYVRTCVRTYVRTSVRPSVRTYVRSYSTLNNNSFIVLSLVSAVPLGQIFGYRAAVRPGKKIEKKDPSYFRVFFFPRRYVKLISSPKMRKCCVLGRKNMKIKKFQFYFWGFGGA